MTLPRGAARYVWLSIFAACCTILLKGLAWWLTGSVGLLSDALESFVNLAGALFALAMVTLATSPPDAQHPWGHGKAEYFSSGFEGTLIFLAAAAIFYSAAQRLTAPQALQALDLGLALSVASTALNFVVARTLAGAARRFHSVALHADARHLMTDVWTTVGVLAGLGAYALTGWQWLDPLIAMGVAANILIEGWRLMRTAAAGLMDQALPAAEQAQVEEILRGYCGAGVRYAALRTRCAGAQRFVHVNILVPGQWPVARAHALLDEIEAAIAARLPGTHTTTHLEPLPQRPAEASGSRSER